MKKVKIIKRTITKLGDWRSCYEVGGQLSFRWHIYWNIKHVIYDAVKDKTRILIEREK